MLKALISRNVTHSCALFALLLLTFCVTLLQAEVINVPADQATIQGGINASTSGDTVLVQPGTYVENIDFLDRNIVLGSLFLTSGDTSHISQTIIDGDNSGTVVTIAGGQDSTAVLCGVTITNGWSEEFGGGVTCIESSPEILSCHIIENAGYDGGGIHLSSSYTRISECEIAHNTANKGGGVACLSGSPVYWFTETWNSPDIL